MPLYKVEYHAGTYEGTRTVRAASEYEAKEKVKKEIRGLMTLPMYSDGYKVVDTQHDGQDDENEEEYFYD